MNQKEKKGCEYYNVRIFFNLVEKFAPENVPNWGHVMYSSFMQFKLPTTPLISKFVRVKYGSVLIAETSTVDGNFYITLIKSKCGDSKQKDFMARQKDYVRIEVSDKQIKDYRFKGFSAQACHLFKQKFEAEFDHVLHMFVLAMREIGINQKDAILHFIDQYDLHEHATYDSLKKREYRYRTKYQKKESKYAKDSK